MHRPMYPLALQFIRFLFIICLLSSCAFRAAPHLPATWIKQLPIVQTTTQPIHQARLQVFVTDTHTALRLESADKPVIFWDPGGEYGLSDYDWGAQYEPLPEGIKRDNDLIVSNPPDLTTFVNWRWIVEDGTVEVFEWDLPGSQAQRLRHVLLHGADDTHPAGSFSTWTFPLFCSIATSDFLRRFVSPTIQLSEAYLFPENLAKALYAQSPSRVRVFTIDGQKVVYVPPGPTSVRQ